MTDAAAHDHRALSRLLDRPVPEADLAGNTRRVAQPIEVGAQRESAVVVVQLGDESVALTATDIARITPLVDAHRIPGRSNAILRGLSSIEGGIFLCVRLEAVLGIERSEDAACPRRRTLVLGPPGGQWTFAVDAVLGVHSVESGATHAHPSTSNTHSRAARVCSWTPAVLAFPGSTPSASSTSFRGHSRER